VSDLGQHDGDGIRYAMHLSAPKGGSAQMLRDPAGGWVSWEDYARLKTEVERLEKEVWRMKVFKGIDEDTKATLKDALNTVPEWAKVLETIENNARLETDNIALKAEVERLTAENEAVKLGNKEWRQTAIERGEMNAEDANAIGRLKAEVERLTKAGDAMWNALLCSGCSECLGMYDCHDEAMKLWEAAKEGGQP